MTFSDLFDAGEPVSPVRLQQAHLPALLEDLGEVELRGVPAADAVVGAEVPLALEVVGCGAVPLEEEVKMF